MVNVIKIDADTLTEWISFVTGAISSIAEAKNGTVHAGFARQRLDSAELNLQNVLDQMRTERRRSF